MLLRLPHRITIQSETRTAFQGGAYTSSWTTDSTEWANCQSSNRSSDTDETYKSNKKQQYSGWKVIMRYNSTLSNKKRLLFGNRILHIETVKDLTNRNRMIEVTCREEVI
jgi:SPP1 family predicted phage head-tail adaptor